jgi:hypothetical protein
MKRLIRAWLVCCLVVAGGFVSRSVKAQRADEDRDRQPAPSAQTLVYADFENVRDARAVSSRGGRVSLWGYQENPTRMSAFKGDEADNAVPKIVRTSKEDQNHAAAFEYEFVIPNQWAGVTLEVQGRPGEAGALPADDVSGYKFLSVQAFATGTSYMRVEVMSNGQGINLHSGYPMTSFKLKEGFNTYKVRLSSFSQPDWVKDTRIDPKDVLKRLTSLTFSVFCDDCRPTKGMVILDSIVFEK